MEIYNGTYCVYMHINETNGKKYIGITKNGDDPNKRWKNGFGYRKNKYFWRAICKYWWDGFEHYILYDNLTEEEAKKYEKWLIYLGDFTNPEYGYNITKGGEGSAGYHPSDETRKKMSEARKGRKNTDEQKRKNSEWHKNNPLPGMFKKGQDPWNKGINPVICLDTEEIFSGAHEAEVKTGIPNANITAVCKGKRKTAGGYHWAYYKEETNVA